jgi:hypothetical protein
MITITLWDIWYVVTLPEAVLVLKKRDFIRALQEAARIDHPALAQGLCMAVAGGRAP